MTSATKMPSVKVGCGLAFFLVVAIPLCQAESVSNKTEDDDHHGGHEEEQGVVLASWRWAEYGDTLTVCVLIMLSAAFKLAFHHISFLSQHFPESCVLILVGVLIGFIDTAFYRTHVHIPTFTSNLFFHVLLPPIILDAAYSIYDRDFLSNLFSIIIYAVFGTLVNIFGIGYGLYLVDMAGWMGDGLPVKLGAVDSLTFGSLISAVDPIAVLAIFQEVGVNVGLYFLVFGESLFNDGVTVVLYNTMVGLGSGSGIADYLTAFFSFFTVVLGGLAVGMAVGTITSFVTRFTGHARALEPLTIFIAAYFAYMLAETLHWSGIISLIGCGIVQKRYAFVNMSMKSYTTVKYATKTMATFCDCIIFLFLGMVTVNESHQEWNTPFVLWALLFCTVFRVISVVLLTAILNTGRIKKIDLREQFIMAYGGLRGAVGFSLAQITQDGPLKNVFLTTTLVIIYFTVFVQGGTIKFLVDWLKIKKDKKEDKLIINDVANQTMEHVMCAVEAINGAGMQQRLWIEVLNQLDEKYVKRWLVRPDAPGVLVDLKLQKVSLDEHYARLYGPEVLIRQCKVDAMLDPASDGPKTHRITIADGDGEGDNLEELKRTFQRHMMQGRPGDKKHYNGMETCDLEEMEAELARQRKAKTNSILAKVLRPPLVPRNGAAAVGNDDCYDEDHFPVCQIGDGKKVYDAYIRKAKKKSHLRKQLSIN